MNFYGLPKPMSLKNIVKALELGDHKKLHNSEYDALMTLEYVRVMCRESGMSFAQLIEEYSVKKRVINNITDNEANEQAEQPV
jgi:DNA polymerase III epsilon subunit-like protein